MRASRGLKWENKMYKPKRSIGRNNYYSIGFSNRARNNGRSTDNVRTDCGFDRSNFRLAGHVDRSKFNRIGN